MSLAGASLVLALAGSELALRLLGLPRISSFRFLGIEVGTSTFVADSEPFWLLDPASRTYHVNANGLRGPWPRHTKHARDLRIICVGDSCTFGVGMRLDQTYGMRLEQQLQSALPGRVVQTTLLALPGYSTAQNQRLVSLYVDELRPDIAVFYVGAWNDFVVAVGRSDAARRAANSQLRLVQIADSVFGAGNQRSGLDYKLEFEAGRAPDGRRVEVAEFEVNLTAMVGALLSVGSEVVFILPPTPADTLRKYPMSAPYHEVVRKFGQRPGIRFVDGPRLFESFLAAVPESFHIRETGRPLLFDDWIHPSAAGHQVLAEAVFASLKPALRVWPGRRPKTPHAAIGPPRHMRIGQRSMIRCSWPAGRDMPERIWVGTRLLKSVARESGDLLLTLPTDLTPGSHPLQMATAQAVFDTGHSIRVESPQLQVEVEVEHHAGELSVRATVPGTPGATVALWFAAARRSPPLPTRFGSFGLQHPGAGGRPAGRPDLPFLFDRLGLIELRATVGDDGIARFQERQPMPQGDVAQRVFAQALTVTDGPLGQTGFLTNVEVCELPR